MQFGQLVQKLQECDTQLAVLDGPLCNAESCLRSGLLPPRKRPPLHPLQSGLHQRLPWCKPAVRPALPRQRLAATRLACWLR